MGFLRGFSGGILGILGVVARVGVLSTLGRGSSGDFVAQMESSVFSVPVFLVFTVGGIHPRDSQGRCKCHHYLSKSRIHQIKADSNLTVSPLSYVPTEMGIIHSYLR